MAEHFEESFPDRDAFWGEALRAPFDALAAGDPAALETIWDLASRRLYGLALWRTACEEDALEAARAAFAATPRPDACARLLASPAARLAWAASVAALAAAHVFIPRDGRPEAPDTSAAVTRPDPELASIARLPRIDERALPALEGDRS